ncbi:hypothetical protein [Sphingomonas hankookensis]|uniref:hypothetical protein n=1 Tax=Sphingomonas hankookensis TaxID=563996 RepID=UPI003F7B1E91
MTRWASGRPSAPRTAAMVKPPSHFCIASARRMSPMLIEVASGTVALICAIDDRLYWFWSSSSQR